MLNKQNQDIARDIIALRNIGRSYGYCAKTFGFSRGRAEQIHKEFLRWLNKPVLDAINKDIADNTLSTG